MIRANIIHFGPYAILFIVVVFFLIKAWMIGAKKLDRSFIDIFFLSLVPISKQGVRNTFNEKLKRYYKRSNKVNLVFYVIIGAVCLVFLLMKSIN